tara:strand:- start:218 stop:514 length:297 start_codon:yes stop_codon:yes gene_type:complete
MTYKGNRKTPKQRLNQKVKKDPKMSGGTMGEKFKPIPRGDATVGTTPDRDMRTGDMIFDPREDEDMTPIGGFGYRDMLKILQAVPKYGGVAVGSYLLK